MVDRSIVSALDKDGYAVVPSVIDQAQVRAMRPLLEAAILEQNATWGASPYYNDNNMVHNLMMHGQPFVDLLSNPTLHEYLSEALDEHCIIYAYTSSSIPPKGGNFSSRVHVNSPRFIENYPTNFGFIVALDDFTESNGATYFLPGSHLSAKVPSEEEFFANAKRVFPKAGDGVIFNARTFHYGGRNETDIPRHAVTMNVCRSFMKQRFDYPRLMPNEMIDKMDPVGRRFIGYYARVPIGLDQYYVAPEMRLYRAGQG